MPSFLYAIGCGGDGSFKRIRLLPTGGLGAGFGNAEVAATRMWSFGACKGPGLFSPSVPGATGRAPGRLRNSPEADATPLSGRPYFVLGEGAPLVVT